MNTAISTNAGLNLITSVNVGSAVSSVTVSNCFSSTYDNYKIMYSNGDVSTSNGDLRLSLSGITTGYGNSWLRAYSVSSTVSNGYTGAGASSWLLTQAVHVDAQPVFDVDILGPYLTQYSFLKGWAYSYWQDAQQLLGGIVTSTSSATGFTVTGSGTTITGGTISVYGYKK